MLLYALFGRTDFCTVKEKSYTKDILLKPVKGVVEISARSGDSHTNNTAHAPPNKIATTWWIPKFPEVLET